ncbi:MAG TPA: YfhO family protein, partial [Thermoanaerobaculia bacterium]|nr:YfhO family protein [Thermoanaerobaculia bacterium]
FDPMRKLLVERKPANTPRPAASVGPSGTLAVGSTTLETPERLVYKVDLSQDLWIYRPQSWDPWWRATIDGKTAPIIRANGVFSAVVVPKGDHRVVWQYRPWPFYVGAAISAIALVTLLFLALAGEPIVMTRRT